MVGGERTDSSCKQEKIIKNKSIFPQAFLKWGKIEVGEQEKFGDLPKTRKLT